MVGRGLIWGGLLSSGRIALPGDPPADCFTHPLGFSTIGPRKVRCALHALPLGRLRPLPTSEIPVMGLLNRKKRAIGLDIGSSSVKLMELEMDAKSGSYRLVAFGMEPLPPEAIVDGADDI